MKRIAAYALLLLALGACAKPNPCAVAEADRVGGPDEDGRFSPAALRQDWRALRCGLETFHAGLYEFTTQTDFDRFFDDVDAGLTEPMTDIAFYALVARAVEQTHERHTRIGMWTDDDESSLLTIFDRGARVFPFEIIASDGAVYIWANGSDSEAPPRGARLFAIDDQRAADVLASLFHYIVSDGAIESSKWSDAARGFRYYYYWHVAQPETFTIDYVEEGAFEPKRITVDALPVDAIRAHLKARYPDEAGVDPEHPVYELEWWPDQRAAVFTLKTFNHRVFADHGVRPQQLFADVFGQLRERGTERLVLDLRDNPGGRKEILLALIPYVMKSPRDGVLRTATSHDGKVNTYETPRPAKDAFRGELYVLVNERTWSAGAEMASFAREFGDAMIIGERTAGRYDGMTAGSAESMTLPNTRLRIEIPRWRIDLAVAPDEHGRGVPLDYHVPMRIEEMVEGVDTQKQLVLELLSAEPAE